MRSLALALALSLALLTPGCSYFEGEGEESVTIRNSDIQPVQVVVSIRQVVGDIMVFGESVRLQTGQSQDYPMAARPGMHTIVVTTSTSIQESLPLEIPKKGDTHVDVTIRRGAATVTTTSR